MNNQLLALVFWFLMFVYLLLVVSILFEQLLFVLSIAGNIATCVAELLKIEAKCCQNFCIHVYYRCLFATGGRLVILASYQSVITLV